MENLERTLKNLIEKVETLTESVDSLTKAIGSLDTIQRDIFNVDTSHDDITSLKNKMQKLIDALGKHSS